MDDEILEISDKEYQKISQNVEKDGYREGASDGRDSVFQQSFDNGYKDGFRIGFAMGKANKDKSSRGNCEICKDPTLMQKTETEVRERVEESFQSQ